MHRTHPLPAEALCLRPVRGTQGSADLLPLLCCGSPGHTAVWTHGVVHDGGRSYGEHVVEEVESKLDRVGHCSGTVACFGSSLCSHGERISQALEDDARYDWGAGDGCLDSQQGLMQADDGGGVSRRVKRLGNPRYELQAVRNGGALSAMKCIRGGVSAEASGYNSK